MGTVPTNKYSLEQRLAAFKDSLKNLVDYGSERATQFKAQAIEAEHVAEERARPAVAKATALIKQYPLSAVAIAVGIGYGIIRMIRK